MKSFLFPGQGSQTIGMGKDIYDQYEIVRSVYRQAGDILSLDIMDISFNGPRDKLNQTRYTQPALFVHSYAIAKLLQEQGIACDSVAGHSLGEYTALVIAGVCSFDAGLRLVKARGELMQHAGDLNPGSMAAIIGFDIDKLESICEEIEAESREIVRIANYNSPSQVVVSGSRKGINQAMIRTKSMGAKRTIELRVSGAFHSPLMQSASKEFESILDGVAFQEAAIPVFSNTSAKSSTNPVTLKDNLKKQITHPVLWLQSMEQMLRQGVRKFYEVGAGTVLTGLMRKIDRKVECTSLNSLERLNELNIIS